MRSNLRSASGAALWRQRGFSLPEVLIAALLFAVSLLGLLQYHQVLLQSFQRQWQYRQAWSLAHQQLEVFAASGRVDVGLPLPGPGWQRETGLSTPQAGCQRLTVSPSDSGRNSVVGTACARDPADILF